MSPVPAPVVVPAPVPAPVPDHRPRRYSPKVMCAVVRATEYTIQCKHIANQKLHFGAAIGFHSQIDGRDFNGIVPQVDSVDENSSFEEMAAFLFTQLNGQCTIAPMKMMDLLMIEFNRRR
jgi:hypothetical protein